MTYCVMDNSPPNPLSPKSLNVNESHLLIEWSDGSKRQYPARLLRQMCPCAHCISEFSREVLLDRENIPADITIEHAEPVGRYALSFRFSDGHSTGIYGYELLKDLA